MPVTVTAAFKQWLKSASNIKLSSDSAVTRITYEGLTNFDSLQDFDKKSIESLASTCRKEIPAITADLANGIAAEIEIPGANVSSISIRRLIVACSAAKFYNSVERTMTNANMHYGNVLQDFKVEYEAYIALKDEEAPKAPTVNDKDNDRKVIKWAPIFKDCLTRTFGHKGPLIYVLRDEATVPDQALDPLGTNAAGTIDSYFGESGSLQDELVARLPHSGPIYKHDNASVFLLIEKATRNTSIESTVKAFARKKDGRAAFLAIVANHAGETKYRAIHKKRYNLLTNIKWNGRSYPLETHVSNHRQAVDDIKECSNHITVVVPDQSQRVEYLIDSIVCSDNTLQASLGLVRANTNKMRSDFELAASTLIEVDPYRRGQRLNKTPDANISGLDFNAGRGSSGVDLRWHHPKEFKALSGDQKDELTTWQKTNEGKKILTKSREAADRKRKASGRPSGNGGTKGDGKAIGQGAWKKKLKRAVKTQNGFKTIMSVLAEEETKNQAIIKALTSSAASPTPTPEASTVKISNTSSANAVPKSISFPATSLKLSSIMKK